MADQLYFSRDTKVLIERPETEGSKIWEMPVLDGFSFSQATNASEITLNEMSDTTGNSRRGRQMFNDSYAPAEWSFSTYARPFKSKGTIFGSGKADSELKHHAVEEVLWAMMVGNAAFINAWSFPEGINNELSNLNIDFQDSNKATLGTANFYFIMGSSSPGTQTIYKIEDCCVNEASLDFDIDGIATINWSGMGTIITEFAGPIYPNIYEGARETENFIRNRLTSLTAIVPNSYPDSAVTIGTGPANQPIPTKKYKITTLGSTPTNWADIGADSTPAVGEIFTANSTAATGNGTAQQEREYGLVLTGGNVTISNNMTFLTPETLGVVNQPLGHVTGTRSVSGSFTCYLNKETNSSADLFEDLMEATTTVTNNFKLLFKVGGSATPRIELSMTGCHLEVPTHSIDDVISLETNFHALPSTIDGTDELTVKYVGVTPPP